MFESDSWSSQVRERSPPITATNGRFADALTVLQIPVLMVWDIVVCRYLNAELVNYQTEV